MKFGSYRGQAVCDGDGAGWKTGRQKEKQGRCIESPQIHDSIEHRRNNKRGTGTQERRQKANFGTHASGPNSVKKAVTCGL